MIDQNRLDKRFSTIESVFPALCAVVRERWTGYNKENIIGGIFMDQVRLFALGGLDEDGKNMYVVEVGESIFVIEAGLKMCIRDREQSGHNLR